jgi:hypothetical protein
MIMTRYASFCTVKFPASFGIFLRILDTSAVKLISKRMLDRVYLRTNSS